MHHPSVDGSTRWPIQFLPADTYRCTSCGNEINVGSTKHLLPCPTCGGQWETMTGGDSVNDPYRIADAAVAIKHQ